MDRHNRHIDDLLFNKLADSTAEADGIDWNSFEARTRKKRLGFWLVGSMVAIVILISGWFMFDFTGQQKQPKLLENHLQNQLNLSDTAQSASANESHNDSVPVTISLDMKTIDTIVESSRANNQPLPRSIENKPSGDSLSPSLKSSELVHVAYLPMTDLFSSWPMLNPMALVVEDSFPWLRSFGLGNKLPMKSYFVRFEVGPSFAKPSFQISSSGSRLMHRDYLKIRAKSESTSVGYHASGSYGKQFGNWTPHVGLGISQNAVFADYDYSYSDRPVLDLDGTILGYQEQTKKRVKYASQHSYAMLELPVGVGYTVVTSSQWTLSLEGQFAPQMLFSAKGKLPDMVFLDQQEAMVSSGRGEPLASIAAPPTS